MDLRMTATVVLDNTEHVQAAIRSQLVGAILDTTNEMRTLALALVPVDTGALYGSIHAEFSKGGLLGTLVAGGGAVDYALYVEYGHHTVSGSWVPPQPYITPAAEYGDMRLQQRLRRIFD